MTDEELDEARAREGIRLSGGVWVESGDWRQAAAKQAARLAREGWDPEDPLLWIAREIAARYSFSDRADVVPEVGVQAALAALRLGVEIGQERAREGA